MVYQAIIFLDILMSKWVFVLLSVLLVGILFIYEKNKEAVFSFFVLFGGGLIGLLMKIFVQRERPLDEIIDAAGYSFPSGHTLKATLFFGTLVYLYLGKIKNDATKSVFVVFCFMMIFLIGLSRYIAGVHWVSDIVGGFVLGVFWLCFMVVAFDR